MGWLQGPSRAAGGRMRGVSIAKSAFWAGILLELPKEQLFYPATQPLFKKLEQPT